MYLLVVVVLVFVLVDDDDQERAVSNNFTNFLSAVLFVVVVVVNVAEAPFTVELFEATSKLTRKEGMEERIVQGRKKEAKRIGEGI